VQRVSGRILLPQPGWRRFRLSSLPEEAQGRPRSGKVWRRGVWTLLWLAGSALALHLTRAPSERLVFGESGLLSPGGLLSRAGVSAPSEPQAAKAAAAARAPKLEVAKVAATQPPEPVRIVAGLARIERQSPAIHQGAQFSGFSNLPSGFESAFAQGNSAAADEAGPTAAQPRRPVGPHFDDSPAAARFASEESHSDEALAVVTPPRVWTQIRGQGCEAAYESYQQTLDMARASEPDVSREAFAQSLENFDAYTRCDLSQPRDISICVAVQGGSAKGVTVKTEPRDARLAACVAEVVSRMRFGVSSKMDLVRSSLTVR
jgi:hypothetical protein